MPQILTGRILMHQILMRQILTGEKRQQHVVSDIQLVNIRCITVALTALLAGQPAIFLKLDMAVRTVLTAPIWRAMVAIEGQLTPSSLLKSARRAMMATLDSFMPEAQASQT
jgi:hypothetical protein